MASILQSAKLKGDLSDEITDSIFYKWAIEQKVHGYLISDQRSDARDRVFEKYLNKSQQIGPNTKAMVMAGFQMDGINEATSLTDFYNEIKKTHPQASCAPVIMDMLREDNIPIKILNNDEGITDKHIEEVEKGIELFVRYKQGGKRQPMSFEGYYEDSSEGHSKFWEIVYVPNDIFRASWGVIGKSTQGQKDYTEAEASELVRQKTGKGNYIKIR